MAAKITKWPDGTKTVSIGGARLTSDGLRKMADLIDAGARSVDLDVIEWIHPAQRTCVCVTHSNSSSANCPIHGTVD